MRLREGDIAHGRPVSPTSLKLTFDTAAQDVVNDFKANGKHLRRVMAG